MKQLTAWKTENVANNALFHWYEIFIFIGIVDLVSKIILSS